MVSQSNPPNPRAGHISFVYENLFYIFGGNQGENIQLPETLVFDPSKYYLQLFLTIK